jgi:pimeloyl-ACP methyl ester carboxylesterase
MPSAPADLSFTSAAGNLRLHAEIRGPKTAPLTVLCLHGLTRNVADFEFIADHLAARYRVIAADQRGRGKSQWDPETARYRPMTYVADMFALLDHLGVERVAVIGTSMGGIMAMLMGAMQPARQSRHLNEMAFPDYGEAQWDTFARRTCIEDRDGRPVAAFDPAILEGLNEADPNAVAPNLWAQWQLLGVIPILAIRGALSDIISAETLSAMAARHPAFTAITLADRGHAPMLDEPAAVAAIDEFLKRLETGPAW